MIDSFFGPGFQIADFVGSFLASQNLASGMTKAG
jgi:hypothetical protein